MPDIAKPDYKWGITLMITVCSIVGGFQFGMGTNAQELKDTVRCIEEIKADVDKTKDEQSGTNKELLNAIIDLKVAIGELRTELRVQRR